MNTSTSVAWATVVLAGISTCVNIFEACDAHAEKRESIQAKRESIIARETLEHEQTKVEALRVQIADMASALSNSLSMVSLYGDLLAAEGGDRFAFERVQHLLWDHEDKKSLKNDPLSDRLDFSIRRFTGDIKDNPMLAAVLETPFFESLDVHAMLGNEMFIQRLYALKHIREFRLNKYLPDIVELLKEEPNLNVVQFAITFINETFEDNIKPHDGRVFRVFSLEDCVLRFEDFSKDFTQMWTDRKDEILARKPKEVRHGTSAGKLRLQTIYIYDPEKPSGVPVAEP